MKGKGDKLISGSLLRFLNLMVLGLSTFYLTPFIIQHIGQTMFGFWSLVGSLMVASAFLDLGLGTALKRFIPKHYAANNMKGVNTVFCSTLFVLLIAGIVVAFSAIVLAKPLYHWIGGDIEARIFTTVFLVLGIDAAFQFPMRAFLGYFEGRLRYDFISLVDIIKILFRTAMIFYFLLHNYKVVAMAVIALTVNILGSFLLIAYFLLKYKDLSMKLSYISTKTIKEVLNYSYKNVVAAIAELMRLQISNLVIATFVGINAVAIYAIASRIQQFLTDAVSAFIGQTVPVFSDIDATGDRESLKRAYYLLIKISTILSVYLGGMAVIAGKNFILRWVGPDFESSYTVLVVLTFGITISLTIYPTYNLLRGISEHIIIMICSLGEGICNLILSLVLVSHYSIIGVAFATMIPITISAGLVLPYMTSRRVTYIRLPEFYLRQYGPVFLKSLMVLTLIYFVVSPLLSPDYFHLMIVGLISLFYFPLLYIIGFSRLEKDEYLMIYERIQNLLRVKGK